MDYSRPSMCERLAAEYVLGTLRGPARRRFASLLPAHPRLRTAVRKWEATLMPLTAAIPPEQPPALVWQRIEARIRTAAPPSSRLAFWRALALIATLTSLVLASFLLLG